MPDALARFLERNRDELAGAPFGVVLVDDEGRVVWATGRAAAALERDPASLRGLHVSANGDARDRMTSDLFQARRQLEQLLGVASHDLQEPLRVVSSFLQLLSRRHGDELSDAGRELLAFAVDGAERMARLLGQLLDWSRVGRDTLHVEPVSADEALDEALANLGTRTSESGARVERAALPRVHADRGQLVRLFQNLVANALKYGKPGEPPVVRVGAERVGEEVRFTVADEGIGIAADSHERIFEPFVRLHGRGEIPGTGIGLAICRRIVERHGGHIGVDSEPGLGATFWFTLPA